MHPRLLAAFALLALDAPAAPAPKDREKHVTNSIGMKLVRIPAGTFQMGSPVADKERDPTEKRHEVRITRAFHLGIHEVTQGQFKEVMGYHPSHFSKDGTKRDMRAWYGGRPPAGGAAKVEGLDTSAFPVENVSWDEAKEFCEKLSALPEERKARRSYRLPAEAEWEYACRGPGPEYRRFHTGDALAAKEANFNEALGRTAKAGSYPANAFGLHDMHGNVSEWCGDFASAKYYEESARDDPQGPAAGFHRVVRGGSWGHSDTGCRSARRTWSQPTERDRGTGFRVVLAPSR